MQLPLLYYSKHQYVNVNLNMSVALANIKIVIIMLNWEIHLWSGMQELLS